MYLGSAEPLKGLPELVAEVEKIRKELEKWRVSGRGLRVQTVDQRRHSASSGAAIMCASCAAKARGRWHGRYGTGRCGALGFARSALSAAGRLQTSSLSAIPRPPPCSSANSLLAGLEKRRSLCAVGHRVPGRLSRSFTQAQCPAPRPWLAVTPASLLDD